MTTKKSTSKIKKKPPQNYEKILQSILLNRILQTDNSAMKKTVEQLAVKHKCSMRKIMLVEQHARQKLADRVGILTIIINTN